MFYLLSTGAELGTSGFKGGWGYVYLLMRFYYKTWTDALLALKPRQASTLPHMVSHSATIAWLGLARMPVSTCWSGQNGFLFGETLPSHWSVGRIYSESTESSQSERGISKTDFCFLLKDGLSSKGTASARCFERWYPPCLNPKAGT